MIETNGVFIKFIEAKIQEIRVQNVKKISFKSYKPGQNNDFIGSLQDNLDSLQNSRQQIHPNKMKSAFLQGNDTNSKGKPVLRPHSKTRFSQDLYGSKIFKDFEIKKNNPASRLNFIDNSQSECKNKSDNTSENLTDENKTKSYMIEYFNFIDFMKKFEEMSFESNRKVLMLVSLNFSEKKKRLEEEIDNTKKRIQQVLNNIGKNGTKILNDRDVLTFNSTLQQNKSKVNYNASQFAISSLNIKPQTRLSVISEGPNEFFAKFKEKERQDDKGFFESACHMNVQLKDVMEREFTKGLVEQLDKLENEKRHYEIKFEKILNFASLKGIQILI